MSRSLTRRELLAAAGGAAAWAGVGVARGRAQERPPARRGGGGRLRLLWWQAATLLNPHFATGTKDVDASRAVHEPLCSLDPDGNLIPVLVAEIPSVERGTLARDGTWVLWRLKKDVVWHDGAPFGAADLVFNWEYASDPATVAATLGSFREIARMERVDDLTVRAHFKQPTPAWFGHALVHVIPRHLHQSWKGGRAREAPHNLKPVGTGPYRVASFRPGDAVRYELNAHYHVPGRPSFDEVELKGGGDAVSAARAVLQTGEYDYAWNVQVEDAVLRRLEQGGRGRVEIFPTGFVEHILLNQADPEREVEGERSSPRSTHPALGDPAVRAALALLVDRAAIESEIYGRLGRATANFLNAPPRMASPNLRWAYDPERAARLLDDAGWKRGSDGVRAKGGKRLRLLFQTAANAPRQKTQALVKQAAARVGIEVELKSVTPSVFFSSDPGNPDTASHFYADLQMYTLTMGSPDPQRFMEVFASWEIASKANQWAGRNYSRFRSEEFDALWRAAERDMDPARRAGLFVKMNDLVVQQGAVIPILWRNGVSAVSNRLRGVRVSGWDSDLASLAYWSAAP
jgi:peptide/nickel transport system substrate-binding protein